MHDIPHLDEEARPLDRAEVVPQTIPRLGDPENQISLPVCQLDPHYGSVQLRHTRVLCLVWRHRNRTGVPRQQVQQEAEVRSERLMILAYAEELRVGRLHSHPEPRDEVVHRLGLVIGLPPPSGLERLLCLVCVVALPAPVSQEAQRRVHKDQERVALLPVVSREVACDGCPTARQRR